MKFGEEFAHFVECFLYTIKSNANLITDSSRLTSLNASLVADRLTMSPTEKRALKVKKSGAKTSMRTSLKSFDEG